MIESIQARIWAYRGLFMLLAALDIFIHLLPLDLSAGRWPGPEFIVALAFAWVLRRPDYVPVILVAIVMLTLDLLYLRPPGLWTALTILGLEFLRSREHLMRDLPFLLEWATVSGVLILMTLACRLILAVFFVDQPSFGLTMIGLIATILSYPVVVIISRILLSIRKIAPGEVDQLGHRL